MSGALTAPELACKTFPPALMALSMTLDSRSPETLLICTAMVLENS